MGFFSFITDPINKIFDSTVGGVLSSLGGSAYADNRANQQQQELSFKNFEKQWNFKSNKGLTPNEIVGTPTSNAPSGANTLGNNDVIQKQQLQKQQLGFQARENALDRQNKIDVVTAQTKAPLIQADLAGDANRRAQDLHQGTKQKLEGQIKELNTNISQSITKFNERWKMKFATMSPQNGLMALLMKQSGLSIDSILNNLPIKNQAEAKAIQNLIDNYLASQSFTAKESAGAQQGIVSFVQKALDPLQELGQTVGFGKSGKEKPVKTYQDGKETRKPKKQSGWTTKWTPQHGFRKP